MGKYCALFTATFVVVCFVFLNLFGVWGKRKKRLNGKVFVSFSLTLNENTTY
jgi:hypothetical protein